MNYDRSTWLFDLHNLYKIRSAMTSKQSYRYIFDNIDEVLIAFEEGVSVQEVWENL